MSANKSRSFAYIVCNPCVFFVSIAFLKIDIAIIAIQGLQCAAIVASLIMHEPYDVQMVDAPGPETRQGNCHY